MQTLTHTHGKMLRESSQTVQDETADSVSICEPDQSLNHLTLAFGFGFPNSCQYTRGPNIAIGMFVLSYRHSAQVGTCRDRFGGSSKASQRYRVSPHPCRFLVRVSLHTHDTMPRESSQTEHH